MVVVWTKYEMVEIGIFSKGWGEGGRGWKVGKVMDGLNMHSSTLLSWT